MRRKSNSKRKGITAGLPRVLTISNRQRHSWLTSVVQSQLRTQELTKFTDSLFNKFLNLSIALCVLPLEKKGGHYRLPTGLRILPFWSYKLVTLLIILHRLRICASLCLTLEITAPVLIAVIGAFGLAFAWIISVWNPAETVFLWNNCNSLLHDLSHKENRQFHRFDEPLLCLKILCILVLIPTCALCGALVNGLLFGGLPASWFRSVQSFGWLNEDASLWWLIVFLPMEAACFLGPLLTAAFACNMALIGLQTMKTYGEGIRRIHVTNLESRQEVEQLFIRWQVFARAANGWIKLFTISGIPGIAGASTMFLFLTIRFSDVPLIIYIFFPVIAFAFLLIMALSLYEAVSVTQLSQQVLSQQLLSLDQSHKLRLLCRGQRKMVMLRAKALKPIGFPLGPFTEIKYAVMADIWEEILNQLLFLLTF